MPKTSKIKVGDRFRTKRCGYVQVIEYVNCTEVWVRFVDTGNERMCRSDNLLRGNVSDRVDANLASVDVGTIHETNNHGKIQVIEYDKFKRIKVVFLQSGKTKWTNGGHIRIGNVAPPPDEE